MKVRDEVSKGQARPLAVRCVATALARSSALYMILARRMNTAISFDFRIGGCRRSLCA